LNELKQIISNAFDCDIEKIDDSSGPNCIEGWDSLGHFKLISQIEEKYNIMLTTNDIFKITNVGDIISILKKYL